VITLFQADDAHCCNHIEVETTSDGMVSIRCENDWAGSTETGFGSYANFTLSKMQALELAQAIQSHYRI
jgi:hypothetical protein